MKNLIIHQSFKPYLGLLQKIPMAMRVTVVLLFVFLFQVRAEISYSQTAKISLNLNNATVEEVLNTIEDNSEFYFLYNSKLINIDRKVDLKATNKTIESILKEIFANTDVQFRMEDRQIILSSGKAGASQQAVRKVTFDVKDETGEPVIGANVMVKGTTNGNITDADGKTTLNVPENALIQISYIGYLPIEVKVSNQNTLSITLKEDTQTLDEVIVVGYGVQKKANVSGAITSVNSKDLHSISTNDPGQALQGKAPVFVSRNSGKPGEGTTVYLRGVGTMNSSNPLWIIDGVPGLPLDNFNEVENIQILKDAASAAIYGVQAANGVILVTTKKAAKGKMSVNYNGYLKMSNTLGLPTMLGTQEYIDMYKARWVSNNPGANEETMHKNIKPFYFLSPEDVNKLPNTDWVNEMFSTGLEHVHSLEVSGASDKSSYYLSGMYQNDEGTYANTSYSQYAFKVRLEQQPLKWLKISEILNYKHSKRKINDLNWEYTFRANPAMNVYDETNPMNTGYGYFTPEFAKDIDWQGGNPLEAAMMKDYWEKKDEAWGNIQAVVTPFEGFVWTTNISGSMKASNLSKFNYSQYGGVAANTADFVTGEGIGGMKQFEYQLGNSRSYMVNTFANYNKQIKKHDFSAMVGFEFSESENSHAKGNAAFGIPTEDLRTSELSSHRDGFNSWGEGSSYSLFGRATYSYDNRYLLTANFRNDASDLFAPGKRNAFFPSVSAGWNIANEKFFRNEAINDLKFRVGYGILGNASVPANLWRQEYTLQTNGTWKAGKVVNNDITWEKTSSTNIGLDFGAWNNALTATVDFYNKETRDALLEVALPTSTGFKKYQVNKGVIRNQGFEVALNYRNHVRDFNYSVGGNISYNENKVKDLGESAYLDGGSDNHNRTYTNGPVSALFGYVAEGLYQSQDEIDVLNKVAIEKGFAAYDGNVAPGDIKFKDLNGDGIITNEDQTTIGNPWPKFVYGFNVNLEYKGFEFAMNWQGIQGNDVYNDTKKALQNMNGDWNSTSDVWKAWNPENKNTSIPRLGNSTHNYGLSNSYMVEDGSYLRLKNVQLGYNFNKRLLTKIKLERLKIFGAVENALTITDFSGGDPEFMNGGNSTRGVYRINQYPQARSFTFGIQIGI